MNRSSCPKLPWLYAEQEWEIKPSPRSCNHMNASGCHISITKVVQKNRKPCFKVISELIMCTKQSQRHLQFRPLGILKNNFPRESNKQVTVKSNQMPQGNKPPTTRTSRKKLQKQIYIEFRYWNFSVTDNKITMF